MKNQDFKFLFSIASILSIIVLFAFTLPQQKKGTPWEVPEKYKKMKNTYKADKSLVSVGKSIYMKHCRSCHGNKGLGDGPKAKNLKTFPGDFSSAEFKALADGVVFYQSIIGRDEMPNYESKIPDEEDRWAVVMYVQSL